MNGADALVYMQKAYEVEGDSLTLPQQGED